MTTAVVQWGNSLAVRLPKLFAEELGLKKDDSIELAIEDDCLFLRRSKPSLQHLVSKITPENRHGIAWPNDQIKGKEVW